jgi:hypothetical protein
MATCTDEQILGRREHPYRAAKGLPSKVREKHELASTSFPRLEIAAGLRLPSGRRVVHE